MTQILREHIGKVVDLSDQEFGMIMQHVIPKNYPKRSFLFREGDLVPHIYFIASGLLKLAFQDREAKEHIISFAMEDWWEGDFNAFFAGTPTSMSLQCLEDTGVYCINLESYRYLCQHIPKVETFFLQKAIAGHITSQQRILSFLQSTASERYDLLLQKYPSLVQRVPKTHLASYLGVSRETLSRLYSR